MNHIGMRLLLTIAVCMAAVGCQRSVPPVPPSHRTVVPPKGSTHITKPWNHTTEREGDAILGPLSKERR